MIDYDNFKIYNYDKIIKKSFAPFAESHGFTAKKSLFWYSMYDGFFAAVGFEKKSIDYETRYFIQPLFISRIEYIVLEYGDTIPQRGAGRDEELMLSRTLEEEEFINNLEEVKNYTANNILPQLKRITSINSLIGALSGKFLACTSLNRISLLAYSALYAGKYEDAHYLFKEYLDVEKSFPEPSVVRVSEPELLLELIERNPEEARSKLQNNVTKNIEILKLNV